MPIGAILRRANEHLNKVVMQGIVKLPLKTPFELRVVEVSGMEIEVVCVDGEVLILELDDHFHAITFGARGKIQQRVLVEPELREDTVETCGGGVGH